MLPLKKHSLFLFKIKIEEKSRVVFEVMIE